MSAVVEFFFDFRSPYSYLAYSQLAGLGVEIKLRPMNVVTVMNIVGNTPTTITCAAKGAYARSDLSRWAKKYGLPLSPANIRAIDSEACLRAVLAAPSDEAAKTITEVIYRACWGAGQTLVTVDDIVELIATTGIDTSGLAARIDDQALVDKLQTNSEEAAARGVFGAPTILIGDVMFFGNDRFEFVRDYLSTEQAA